MQRATILLDMDGVTADFARAACEIHGRADSPIPCYDWWRKGWDMSDEDFWAPIKAHPDFYDTVQPTPWFDDLMHLLRQCHGDGALLTANPADPLLIASKMRWINRYLPGTPVILVTPDLRGNYHKERLAGPNQILIDDYDKNLVSWVDAGGKAIRVNQSWNEGRLRIGARMQDIYDNLILLGVL
jgi:5'-nucleotidase